MENAVEGKVKSVDQTGKKVTLDDGTQLMIPASVEVDWKSLKQGLSVSARYEEKRGQKVVITQLEVRS